MTRFAFCLFSYFPYGGLQIDFRQILALCQHAGHTVDIYTMDWQGPLPDDHHIHFINTSALTNHSRAQQFSQQVMHTVTKQQYDCIVGFNQIPGIDVYFAADVCFAWKMALQHPHYYRWLPRYHTYLTLERKLFQETPHCLWLTPMQQANYQAHYHIADDKNHLLLPGLTCDWQYPTDTQHIRQCYRDKLNLAQDEILLLSVGSHFKTKGISRSLRAYAALSATLQEKTHFIVIGKSKEKPYLELARKLQIESQITFLGAQSDILPFMLAADLLLHPALYESAGLVLLEALTLGLPIITTQDCGHAWHIQQANAGMVLPTPFSQHEYNNALYSALSTGKLATWKTNGLTYAKQTQLHGLHEKAVNIIETVASNGSRSQAAG